MALFRSIYKASVVSLSSTKSTLCLKAWLSPVVYFGTKIEVPVPPKRPLTAYMIFCKENRKNLLKEHPSLSSPEQIKVLAEKWSHLSTEMKKPYEVSARESTLLYGELHKKFYENLTEEQKEELVRLKAKKRESRRALRLKKALKDSGLPKSPTSAYALFIQSEAKRHHVTQPSDFIKKCAEMWKNLPEEKKSEFENLAQEDKKRFSSEMSEWRKKMEVEGKTDLIKASEETKRKTKPVEEVERPPTKKSVAASKKSKGRITASKK